MQKIKGFYKANIVYMLPNVLGNIWGTKMKDRHNIKHMPRSAALEKSVAFHICSSYDATAKVLYDFEVKNQRDD